MKEAIEAIVDGVKTVALGIMKVPCDSNESRAVCLRQLSETLINIDRLNTDEKA